MCKQSILLLSIATMVLATGDALAEWTNPMPLAEVNSDSAEEWSPSLSPDGLVLYFGRVLSETSYWGRIFQATRDEPFGPFTSVAEVPGPLNSITGHVLCPWVSPDQLRMYYNYQPDGFWPLKVSERYSISEPWPTGIDISELNKLGNHLHSPRLTPDELTIFFSSTDIAGGYGGYDIWMATRPDRNSSFGQVRNLEELNTLANETHAFVSADGLTLYFSSDRDGSFQIFMLQEKA